MDRTHRFFPSWRVSIRWGLSAAIVVVLLAVAYSFVLPTSKTATQRLMCSLGANDVVATGESSSAWPDFKKHLEREATHGSHAVPSPR